MDNTTNNSDCMELNKNVRFHINTFKGIQQGIKIYPSDIWNIEVTARVSVQKVVDTTASVVEGVSERVEIFGQVCLGEGATRNGPFDVTLYAYDPVNDLGHEAKILNIEFTDEQKGFFVAHAVMPWQPRARHWKIEQKGLKDDV